MPKKAVNKSTPMWRNCASVTSILWRRGGRGGKGGGERGGERGGEKGGEMGWQREMGGEYII